MDNKDDKIRIDNPFDESFYIIPEEEVESGSEDNEIREEGAAGGSEDNEIREEGAAGASEGNAAGEDEIEIALEEDTDISELSDDEGCTFINLAGVYDKAEFHARIREALDVPDYYGDNLDALYDVLTEDISERIIRISGANKVAENMRDYIARFRMLCDDVNDESESVRIVFSDERL